MKTFTFSGKPHCPASGTFTAEYVSCRALSIFSFGHYIASLLVTPAWRSAGFFCLFVLFFSFFFFPKPSSCTLGNFVGKNSGASKAWWQGGRPSHQSTGAQIHATHVPPWTAPSSLSTWAWERVSYLTRVAKTRLCFSQLNDVIFTN